MSAWIADQLHNILGYSDTTLERYVESMAKNSKTEQ